MKKIFLENDNKLSIKTNNKCDVRSIVEFSLTEDKKEILVIEGYDYYLAGTLNYEEITKLIDGLKKLRSLILSNVIVDIIPSTSLTSASLIQSKWSERSTKNEQ